MGDYIIVEKNGIKDEMNKTVWDAIGGDSNKDGWRRVIDTPVEVLQIKSKKVDPAPAEAEAQSPEGEVQVEAQKVETAEEPAVKSKAKSGKKK